MKDGAVKPVIPVVAANFTQFVSNHNLQY